MHIPEQKQQPLIYFQSFVKNVQKRPACFFDWHVYIHLHLLNSDSFSLTFNSVIKVNACCQKDLSLLCIPNAFPETIYHFNPGTNMHSL